MRLALAAACALLAAEAAAHAELVTSTPMDGAALTGPPARIELVFNEPVRVLSLGLVDDAGKPVPIATAASDRTVTATTERRLADGHYVLSYRIASLDSHPVSGAIAFGIGAVPPPAPAAAKIVLEPWPVVLRALRNFALLLAAGGALFMVAVGGFPRDRALLCGAAAAGIGCALALLGLQNTGLESSFALSSCVACIGLGVVGAGALACRRILLAIGAGLALAGLPLTGHAVGAPLAMAALAAHGLAAAFWLGSLAALALLLRRGNAAGALRRFSAFGVGAVVLLLACGVALAALHLESPEHLWRSSYGQLVLGKAAALALLIAVALVNRCRLLPLLERGDRRAEPALRSTVAFELGLLGVVILLTAALVQTPPRADAREEVLVAGGRTATVAIEPGAVTVRLRDAQGAPLDAAEVTLEFSNPAVGVEGLVRPARRIAAGHYRHEGATYVSAAWRVTVHARIGEFEKVSFLPSGRP